MKEEQSLSSTMAAEKNIGLILLAAGASKRLGRSKQLLKYRGQTLLEHSLETALASMAETIVVVLGANAEQIGAGIKNDKVQVVINCEWKEGMASSIRSGIKAITKIGVEGIILMVCDQPYVTCDLLNELIAAHKKTGKQIVACSYQNTFGPPVFFHHSLFDKLLQLKGDVGARNIVKQHSDLVEVIPFAEGAVDVDTEADYQNLRERI
jgi:molybdenum cofactor cytidylyltransferase